MIGAAFFLFILTTSNPFTRLNPAPVEGRELNPVLQDLGLAIHPPLLYLGYVGFSVCFSFAVAALLEGRIDAAWARWVRPWTLAAWTFLTLGIAMDVSRASQTHQVPHIGLPQIAPVTRDTKVNAAPRGAATRAETSAKGCRQTSDPTAFSVMTV